MTKNLFALYAIDRYITSKQQWLGVAMNMKIVYPIAKKRVVGATRVTDYDSYETINNVLGKGIKSSYTILSWILTVDDYILARDPYTNELCTIADDYDLFCFICY